MKRRRLDRGAPLPHSALVTASLFLRQSVVAVPMTALMMLACATSSPTIAGTTFAPSLGVDTTMMTSLGQGLWYRDLAPGSGDVARRGSDVGVYYTGWLADGTMFEATQPPEAAVRFRLGSGEVIAGWERGIVGMRVGGRRQLVIPPSLGYGAKGAGSVPPHAVLVFTIELLDVR